LSSHPIGLAAIVAREGIPFRRAKVRHPPRSLAREIRKEPAFRSLLLKLLVARLTRPRTERCQVEIECYPGIPYHRHVVWKIALYAGAKLRLYQGEEPQRAVRLRLFWPDISALSGSAQPLPSPPPEWWHGALNGGSRDTGKRTAERVFEEVFGYRLAVDPTAHKGPCVAKSNFGSTHDGRVLDCPIAEADPALAYEVLIDNRADGDTVLDLRVPIVGGDIPFVYMKYRPLSSRFSNTNTAVTIAEAEQVFSASEREGIRQFCQAMGLDLGELDVLRDAKDGRVYIVDVNRTAWGPPRPLRTADAAQAVRSYAGVLARLAERTPVPQADLARSEGGLLRRGQLPG
jgi:hypothetical protein